MRTTLLSILLLVPTVATAASLKDFCAAPSNEDIGVANWQQRGVKHALCDNLSSLRKDASSIPVADYAIPLERHDIKGKELIRAFWVVSTLDARKLGNAGSNYLAVSWDARHLDRAKMESQAVQEIGITAGPELKARIDELYNAAKELADISLARIPATPNGKALYIEAADRAVKDDEDFYLANKAILDVAEAIDMRVAQLAMNKHVESLEGCKEIRAKLDEMYAAKKPHSIAEVEAVWFDDRLGQKLFRRLVLCAAAEGNGALATSLETRQKTRIAGGSHLASLLDIKTQLANKTLESDFNRGFMSSEINELWMHDPTKFLLDFMESKRDPNDWSPTVRADDEEFKIGETGGLPSIQVTKISGITKKPDGTYVLKSTKQKIQYPVWECQRLNQLGWNASGEPTYNKKCKLVKMESLVVDFGDVPTHGACAAAFKVGRQIKYSIVDIHFDKAKTYSVWLVFEATPKGPKYLNYFGVDLTK